ncbi:hypothetical protein E1B28_008117 [Marasmius oreades]|uniref:Amine oxidase domain-containing protein n=1 Tax=Marasmius oreades TaxID=181124 RepID=A0A9P7RYX9_9AGAR|nr:uncharacterized protein E1B28_008117 [Marasmius oreades]KAG7091716.1 hypothetical protein E1B28_008117 [Marasmius oreades]
MDPTLYEIKDDNTLEIMKLHTQKIMESFQRRFRSPVLSGQDQIDIPYPKVGRVAIVGAGVAGLLLALRLGKDTPVDVYEASDRVGGRLYTRKFSGGGEWDYFDVGAMRFPDTGVMKPTYDLFKELDIPLLKYQISCDETWLCYNDIRVNRGDATGQDFGARVSRGGNVPDEWVNEGVEALMKNVYGRFLAKLRADFRVGYEELMKYDEHSTRSFMAFVELEAWKDPNPPGDEYPAKERYPTSVVNWLETMTSSVGSFDMSLSETILHYYCFAEGLPNTEWRCVKHGSEKITDKLYEILTTTDPFKTNVTIRFGSRVTRVNYHRDPPPPPRNPPGHPDDPPRHPDDPPCHPDDPPCHPDDPPCHPDDPPCHPDDPPCHPDDPPCHPDDPPCHPDDPPCHPDDPPRQPDDPPRHPDYTKDMVMSVTSDNTSNTIRPMYSQVVLTVSPQCMRYIDLSTCVLDYNQRSSLLMLTPGPSVKVGIKFKRNWWADQNITGGQSATDRPVRTVVYPSYGGAQSTVLIASYNWTQDASNMGAWIRGRGSVDEKQLKDTILADLASVHGIKLEDLNDWYQGMYAFDWSNDSRFMSAFAAFNPGQFSFLLESLTRPAAGGRLHFAGDAISACHGWVAGAIESANRVVNQMNPPKFKLPEGPLETMFDSDVQLLQLAVSAYLQSKEFGL